MQSLDEILRDATGGYRAPGAVVGLQAEHGGLESVGVNVEPTELLEIGSITKTMTALLVLQHVERGQIELDDPVVTYLPGLRVTTPGDVDGVTIRHLLTHASGIDCGDDFTDTGDGDDCLERYVDEAVRGAGFLHPPGQRWSYCNGGYSVLGRLVEVLDGRAWDDALIERVFRPLGLSATTTARLQPGDVVATGHRYDESIGAMVEEPGRMPRSSGPAGNVVATVADLITFSSALFGGSCPLLGDELVAAMTRPQVQIREGAQGLAWLLPSSGLAVHGGATRGSTAFLAAMPGTGSLCVLANGPGAGAIAGAVRRHLFGTPAPPGPMAGPGPDVEPEACVGRFARRHAQIDLALVDGRVVAASTFSGPASELFPAPTPVVLEPIGGGRFVSRRPHEDGATVWDFDDLDDAGVPCRLLTRRLSNRTRSAPHRQAP
ncbi:MAG: serine hydrolase domain-containing protein [Acidimicrobiales bacterium]